jgi:TonB-linked SusC/RagA family outer membrane protein
MKRLISKYICVAVLLLIPVSLFSQNPLQATGTVVDATGEPLPGASIVLKGTNQGTVANADGNFTISVSKSTDILVVSMLSFEKKEVQADVSKPMTIVLEEETKFLDEVVVIGYQDVLKRDLTGSVGKANVNDMLKAPVSSFDQALAGRLAGVTVSSGEGMPGGTMNIVIRGNNSITQENSPLFIVDGFPVEDASIAASINPNDIESINVLKDASATAIYGSRGANGVFIITTKKGIVGKMTVSYDGSTGVHSVTRQIPMMDAYDFVKLQSQVWSLTDMSGEFGYFSDTNGKIWTQEDYRNIDQYDWQDMIFREALQQSHNLSLSGGAQDSRYNASVSYFDQDGVLLASNYNRVQGRLGSVVKRNKLTAQLTVNYSQGTTTGNSPSSSQYSGMNNLFYSVWGYRPVTQPNVNLSSLYDNATDENVDATNDYRFNPILSLKNEYRKRIDTYSQYNGFAEYEFIKGLKLKVSGGYTVNSTRSETFNNSKTRYGSPASSDKVNATLAINNRKTWLNENTLAYQTNIQKIHALSAVVGMSMQESLYDSNSMKTIKIPNESLGMAGMAQGEPNQVTSLVSEWSMMSYFGRLNYNYKSKYYFTSSFRADGSSKFAKGNHFGYFPSASLAWTFTSEKFMEPVKKILDSGKLRLSWGQSGNNRVKEYDTYAMLNILQGSTSNDYNSLSSIIHGVYPYNNMDSRAGAVPYSLGNKGLKWETTTQSNIGLDLSILDGKIELIADWYRKTTSDLLLQASLPPSSGYISAMKNIGEVQNQGLEFTLNTVNIQTKDFKWTTNFNISFNKNKVLELAENQLTLLQNAYFDQNFTAPNYIAKKNYPLGMMYGYLYEGTYKIEDFDFDGSVYRIKPGIPTYTSEANTQPGYPRYVDVNKDGIIDSNDQTIIGKGDPIHVGGFTNNFEWKNFDLSVFFQWSYGNDILNANKLFFESGFNKKKDLNQYASYADRFILGDESTYNSNIPAVSASGSNNLFSSRIIEDGSYLRLKTLSFGYTFPAKLVKKASLSKARIYCSMQNLFTITNYSGYDPEVSVRNSALTPGLDYSSYPRSKSFNLGVNLVF